MRLLRKYGDTLLLKELKASYHFFIKEANVDSKSRGYGLIKDKDMYADEIAKIIQEIDSKIHINYENYE